MSSDDRTINEKILDGHCEKKDRFDAWVAAAQILLGVRETTRGIVDPASSAGRGWLGTASAAALR